MSEEETRRQEILAVREENERTADRLERGTAYHEPVEVYFTDRRKHTVEVHALSTKELRDAMKKSGFKQSELDELKREADQAKAEGRTPVPDLDKYRSVQDFFYAVTEAAVKSPPNILSRLAIGEEASIAVKAFEIMNPPKN